MRPAPASASEPEDFTTRKSQALVLGFHGDFEASLVALQKLVVDFPDELDARFELAVTQMMLGHYGDACSNLRYVLEVDPLHAKAKEQVGYCEGTGA